MREGWEYKKLGDCFPYIKNGANIKQIKNAKGYPITRIETLSGGVFNRDRMGYADIFDLGKYNEFVIENGDLLMSHINSKAYIGRTVEYRQQEKEIIIHGMNLLRLKSNESMIISAFFAYYTQCKHYKADIARIRKDAVNQSSFAISSLKKITIPLPSVEIQRSIISELDKINELIRLKKEQLKDYDNLAQSIFYEMFGDPVDNEKGWEIKSLKKLIKVVGGYAFKSKDFKEEGIPVLRIGNINSGEFKPVNLVFWDKDEKLSRYRIVPGDLVISLTGTVGKSDYGNICILDNSYDEYYLNQRNAKLEIYGDIDKFYLSRILKVESIKEKLTNVNRGVRQANIANKDIENLQIPLPPLSLQQSFAKRIECIEKLKEQTSKEIKDLETLLASRMQYWFD